MGAKNCPSPLPCDPHLAARVTPSATDTGARADADESVVGDAVVGSAAASDEIDPPPGAGSVAWPPLAQVIAIHRKSPASR